MTGTAGTRWLIAVAGLALAVSTLAVARPQTPVALAPGLPQPSAEAADLLIVNGRIYPAGGSRVFYEALAVRGNRVSAVGTAAEIARYRGAETTIVDARGGAVMPGFNDVHTHMLSGGLEMDNVDLQGAQTLDDVQTRIRNFSASHRDRSWVRGRGWGY